MPDRPAPRTSHRQTVSERSPAREHWIAEAAYFLSEKRGFAPGSELEDWLEAERAWLRQARRDTPPPRTPRSAPAVRRSRTPGRHRET